MCDMIMMMIMSHSSRGRWLPESLLQGRFGIIVSWMMVMKCNVHVVFGAEEKNDMALTVTQVFVPLTTCANIWSN